MDKFLIVGLGNPGTQYKNTRHNVGQMFLFWLKDNLTDDEFEFNKFCLSSILKINLTITKRKQERHLEIILAFPSTFMNESGKPIKKLLNYYHFSPKQLFVIHDDNDLKIGQFKIAFGHTSAGHKGILSIINYIQSKDFHRIKIGIQPLETKKRVKAEEIVLQKFSPEEKEILNKLFPQIKAALESYFKQII